MTGRDFRPDEMPDWDAEFIRTPAPIVPVPAAAYRGDIRGKRVIIGLPGLGWRADLRADSPIVQGSRTYVPVLSEQEWYRAEAEQTEVFAPLVPIERVWVESIGDLPPIALASLDTPPIRLPLASTSVEQVCGRRLVQIAGPENKTAADIRDLRAVTDQFTNTDGERAVRIALEADWYRWAWTGQPPRTREVECSTLWAE